VNGRSYWKSPVTIEDLDPTKTFKVVLKKRGHGTVNRLLSFGDTFEQTLDVDLSGSSKDKDKASEGGSKEDEKVAQQSSTKTGDKTDGASSSHGEKEGYLLAMTQPFAKVFIDDKDTGKMTPISQRDRIPLKPGKHKVTFVTSSKRVHFDVVIRAGAEEKLIRNLNEE
jgi:hypothetical protein